MVVASKGILSTMSVNMHCIKYPGDLPRCSEIDIPTGSVDCTDRATIRIATAADYHTVAGNYGEFAAGAAAVDAEIVLAWLVSPAVDLASNYTVSRRWCR